MMVGHERASGLYYEVLGAGRPLLFIHGGGSTGACWRTTLDGRPGWADALAQRGERCWVADWPGTGRSGGRHALDVTYDDVVDAHRRLLRDVIGEPVVVVCHSMGGAVTWALIEREPALVTGVVSVAGAYPGNLAPSGSEILGDDGSVVEVRFADTGVVFTVDRRVANLYSDAYVEHQAIATSTRFPRDRVPELRAGLVGLPPRMLLQRLGVEPGMPVVDGTRAFAGKRIRLVAGDQDPAHKREIDERTAALLRSWGADASLVWLADRGIAGNGHFPMFESNGDVVLDVVAELIDEVRVP